MGSSPPLLVLFLATACGCCALTPAEVLVVGNRNSPVSRSIIDYYISKRGIPSQQVLLLNTEVDEEISRAVFDREIAEPLGSFLKKRNWVDRILAIVTTSGVPLKIAGSEGRATVAASVDSEIAALYADFSGTAHLLPGPVPNPYFRSEKPLSHPEFPVYLVTRLTGYSLSDVRAIIDRSLAARNRGVVVLDQREPGVEEGDNWLQRATHLLPKQRVLHDETTQVVRGASNVIGYASWGSNDRSRRERNVGFHYLPGALVTEFVSTDGRTFQEPPESWSPGPPGKDRTLYFGGSTQTLSADFLRQGATGASGHVYEPYLPLTPRPEVLFPAYLSGRTLAESFWAAIPALSWMNIVVGDPLCRLIGQ
ncbi:TIGR03790 family protein [uncultured Paludibaculum sp.]|uniref:TIGR03790 family protein n=1 Tax=uncultured Paludibaculum sp. TaxID=1765020 RepID=UPI002AABAE53|nr:TIGR03790 family protein [uncultured Paludibaculum sp.]